MTTIPLGVSHYTRMLGRTPQILLVNMIVEKDPTNPVDGLVRFGRPGLAPFASVGAGPSRGLFRQPGTFGGDWLDVSGVALYRVSSSGTVTALGAIGGAGRVTMAANSVRALIATGGFCYSTDGTTVTEVAMPDGEPVSSVTQLNGYFILTVAESHTFFWIPPGGVNPDALDFASAELAPDNLVIAKRLFDELWLFGEATTEVWQPTGGADAPFQRIEARLYEKGCASRDTVATTDNTLFWVGDDLIVYRADAQPVRISDHALEESLRINGGVDLSAWAFALDGHTFYVLTIGGAGTYVHDIESGAWARWNTHLRETWRALVGAQSGPVVIAGDDTTGDLWRLDPLRANDNGLPLVREIMGGVPHSGPRPLPCNNVALFVATGWADIGVEPIIELNYSDDGVTFPDPWYPLSLGTQGQYGTQVVQRRLGAIKAPGRLFRVRMSDDALYRISWAKMNES